MIFSSHALRSLRHPNLRIFFAGQGVSLIGTWITNVATAWLVYRLTDSEFWLGVAAFSGQVPTALLSPFAGVLADRFDRRRVLLWTQSLSMMQSFLLAWFAATGSITVHQVILLNIFQAVVNAFDLPARQAMLPALLPDRLDLTNAVALQAAMFHGARLVGPALAGILLAFFGEAVCFAVDGVSYGAVIISLSRVRPKIQPAPTPGKLTEALVDGARYAISHSSIRFILVFVSLFALIGTPQITLLPVFAREVFHGGPRLYGFLMASSKQSVFSLESGQRGRCIGAEFSVNSPQEVSKRLQPLLQGEHVFTPVPFFEFPDKARCRHSAGGQRRAKQNGGSYEQDER